MGKLFVVGLGPGDRKRMTNEAVRALDVSDVLCGYTTYLDLVRPDWPDKEYVSTPMRAEIERCRKALELAEQGKTVAMVCSGDAGVYGMAGPILELAEEYPRAEVAVVPGVTAALSGAALLGAPLGHDFMVLSLSDLLTPWELIERRLRAAALGDLALAVYNPGSHKRRDYLKKACDVLMDAGKSKDTACGLARNIGREGEETQLLTLSQLRQAEADMFITVFIGNSQTRFLGGKLVTPRGYTR